jgi:hypothetical protein
MTAKSIVVCRVLPQGFLSQVRQACSNVDSWWGARFESFNIFN